MFALGVSLSLLIGISLGLLGGGGSILTLPILVHVMHVEPKPAIAMSLFVVGATSATSLIGHARARNVRWSIGGVFGIGGVLGATVGSKIAFDLPGRALLAGFVFVMFATSLAMMRPRAEPTSPRAPSLVRAVGVGLAVGVMAGLVGAGGGFLVVPALAMFGGLSIKSSIGTSLLAISLQSFAGFAVQVGHQPVDGRVLTAVTLAAVVGSLPGAWLAKRVEPATLRRAFGWFILAMASLMLAKLTTGWAALATCALVGVLGSRLQRPLVLQAR